MKFQRALQQLIFRRRAVIFNLVIGLLMAPLPAFAAQSVIISWDENSENDLAGYRIYVGERSGQYKQEVYGGNVTSYRLTGLKGDTEYFFVVTALDYSGNESEYSDEVTIVTPPDPQDDGETDEAEVLGPNAYNYPNPFRVSSEVTTIRYEMIAPGRVTIQILDANTNLVKTLLKDEFKNAGEHLEDRWDGTNRHGEFVANGVYFCSIRSETDQKMVKIALTR